MAIQVFESAAQDIFFADTLANALNNPEFCGGSVKRTFTWTPAQPSFLSIDASKTVLTLYADDPAYASVTPYSFTVEISLTDYPTVPSIFKTFKVTITCQVSSVTITQLKTIKVEPELTSQPLMQAFSTTQTPACGLPVTFSWK